MNDIKRMDIKEFRELGYLQEVNRLFFHPLGLALEVIIEENGEEKLGGIRDSREDPEGFIFDFKNRSQEDNRKSLEKVKYIAGEIDNRRDNRAKNLGFWIEQICVD